MFRLNRDIGIDLGTANVVVYQPGKGIVLREPSVVAVSVADRKIVAYGEKAREMLGRTPTGLAAVRPIVDGVIAEYTHTQKMIDYIYQRVCGTSRMLKVRALLSVPSNATTVQRRAVKQAAEAAGARIPALTVEQAKAAAIGAGLPIAVPGGNLVVSIGAGTTDVAVLSMNGIVVSQSLSIGGLKFDDLILKYVKSKYNVAIGDRTAEEIKIAVGCCLPLEKDLTIDVRGRDLVSGMPSTVRATSEEVRKVLQDPVVLIVEKVMSVLEQTPPELASDIMERGILLTGGSARLRGLDAVITQATGVHTRVADDPTSCVALGLGKMLEQGYDLREEFYVAGSLSA